MQPIDTNRLKYTYTTHRVPLAAIAGYTPLGQAPRLGDLVLAEVLSLGKHATIEARDGLAQHIFPNDRLVVAFGNRYATDQYEGYVPAQPCDECDLLSVGGVCGELASRHASMGAPTRLRVLGAACEPDGRPLNLREFALPPQSAQDQASVILVVGASMNAGKTTTMGTLARALTLAGKQVAAAKVTGTAAGKDGRYIASCGAAPVLDFTYAGFPATYMLDFDDLMGIYRLLIGQLRATRPDYIIVEIADGIFQRETRMFLECPAFRAGIDHVFFAANDSLSAECGVRWLQDYRLPVRATSGAFTQSPLAIREAEAATHLPALSVERMLTDELLDLLGVRALELAARSARPLAA